MANIVREHKELTLQQVLRKLTALCARSEHCRQDMLDKMRRWEVKEEIQAEAMAYLAREKYVDDARYARFFINDKVKYNKWGRRKVELALRMKNIDESISRPILDEFDGGNDYYEILLPLIRSKLKTVKGGSDYEIRMKLIRFALQRGFTMDVIEKTIEKINRPTP